MRLAAQVVAVLAALAWAGAGLWPGPGDDVLLDSGRALLLVVLVAAPLAGLALRPGTPLLAASVIGTGVAVVVSALAGASLAHVGLGAGIVATGALVGRLGRTPWRTPLYVDQGSAALAGISLLPAVALALDERREPLQGAIGLAVLAACLLLAVSDGQPGRLLVRLAAVVTAVWIGVESVVWPERMGSLGVVWGWLAATWGLLLLAALLAPKVLRR